MAQHLSIRVPWKDNGYTGLVCNKPCYNSACLRLKNIAENRDDKLEQSLCGQPIKGHEKEIHCLSEGACFMSNDEYTKIIEHPYKKTYKHFRDTELKFPPYSLPARPFRWTMLRMGDDKENENIRRLLEQHGIAYIPENEPQLSFNTNWVQNASNQRAIFKTFYKDVKINQSLVIPYAKQVPFIDDPKRVVMGIGFVTSITEPPEYNHTDEGNLRSILWETMVGHSIRNNRKNGFLLPYWEMMKYAENHPDFDISSIVVLAEDDYFDEFSYATEHLSYDAVISVLLQTIKVLNIIKKCIDGNWDECIEWTVQRFKEVWEDRGAYAGLAPMLSAMGFKCSEVMAKEIKNLTNGSSDFDSILFASLKEPNKFFSDTIAKRIGNTETQAFLSLSEERRNLFWLLSRISLSPNQANAIFNPEQRNKSGIFCTDRDILENPYILYEKTRNCHPDYRISLKKIDAAVFPYEKIREKYPLNSPSKLDSGNDKRRVRAYIINQLETQALNGHSVYPTNHLISEINLLPINPPCEITLDIINSIPDFMDSELELVMCKDGQKAYQLKRLYEMDELIRSSINKRLNGKPHEVNENWRSIVDHAFGASCSELEEKARTEKAEILKEIAKSRLSVLIGGAGTGKTTLLSLLCKSKQISDGGVLLLAPTGKARVSMCQAMKQNGINAKGKTVAQFLTESKRFNAYTMEYRLSDKEAIDVPFTVIIDESSMLTEEMFAALLQALRRAQRIIFVGDPNQLPPIGCGRPFVDLVRKLKNGVNSFPKVAKGFGELTITRRQRTEDGQLRGDTELSKWYTNESSDYLNDEIFLHLQNNSLGKHIAFKNWTTPEDLQQ